MPRSPESAARAHEPRVILRADILEDQRREERKRKPREQKAQKTEARQKPSDLDTQLRDRYGVEPAQVYFKLGKVDSSVARRMKGDPQYQEWVRDLQKQAQQGLAERVTTNAQTFVDEETWFEEGDRMAREAAPLIGVREKKDIQPSAEHKTEFQARVEVAQKVLGQAKAAAEWERVVQEGSTPEQATAHVFQLADLERSKKEQHAWNAARLDELKAIGLSEQQAGDYLLRIESLVHQWIQDELKDAEFHKQLRATNLNFKIPATYNPVIGSGGSRPTAMRSLARARVSAPEAAGVATTAIPVKEQMAARIERPKKKYETLLATSAKHTHAPAPPMEPQIPKEAKEPTRNDLEGLLLSRYGVEPARLYFKLGEVNALTARLMNADPAYQDWVRDLKTQTGEILEAERAQEEAAIAVGTQRLIKATKARDELEEEKWFEKGDRMTREAEAQQELLRQKEELHAHVAELVTRPRTPEVQRELEEAHKRIEATEDELYELEYGSVPPRMRERRISPLEKAANWFKGRFHSLLKPRERSEKATIQKTIAVPSETPPEAETFVLSRKRPSVSEARPHAAVLAPEPPKTPEPPRTREIQPPTNAEIESKVLLEFQRTIENPAVKTQLPAALQFLLDDYLARATSGKTSSEYPGWTKTEFAKAAGYLRRAIEQRSISEAKRVAPEPPPVAPPSAETGGKSAQQRIRVREAPRIAPKEIQAFGNVLFKLHVSENPKDQKRYAELFEQLQQARALPKDTATPEQRRAFSTARESLAYAGYRDWRPEDFQLAYDELQRQLKKLVKPLERLPSRKEVESDVENVIKEVQKLSASEFDHYFNALEEYVQGIQQRKNVLDTEYEKEYAGANRGWTVRDYRKLYTELEKYRNAQKILKKPTVSAPEEH